MCIADLLRVMSRSTHCESSGRSATTVPIHCGKQEEINLNSTCRFSFELGRFDLRFDRCGFVTQSRFWFGWKCVCPIVQRKDHRSAVRFIFIRFFFQTEMVFCLQSLRSIASKEEREAELALLAGGNIHEAEGHYLQGNKPLHAIMLHLNEHNWDRWVLKCSCSTSSSVQCVQSDRLDPAAFSILGNRRRLSTEVSERLWWREKRNQSEISPSNEECTLNMPERTESSIVSFLGRCRLGSNWSETAQRTRRRQCFNHQWINVLNFSSLLSLVGFSVVETSYCTWRKRTQTLV